MCGIYIVEFDAVLNRAFPLVSMKEMICRLCLQSIANNNCRPVEVSLLKSLKLNINISKENVMCIECANCVPALYNFMPGRAYMKNEGLPISDLDNAVKLNPEAVETTINPKSLTETEIKCSFCTKAHGREELISLEDSKENKFMVNVLERYISETNLKNTEELLACETCLGLLESVLCVIWKCLEVEEKISKYIELEGTNDKGQVELKEVQQFTFKPILKPETESFGVDKLESRDDHVQEEYTMTAEAEIKFKKEISNTELVIKTEYDDITFEQSSCEISHIKSEPGDCDGFQEPFTENKNPPEIKMFQCELCLYQTKRKRALARHLLIHKNPSEVKRFECESCSYETKRKSELNRHLLTHKSPSEIKMFQCELCSYQSKWKGAVTRHSLTHVPVAKRKSEPKDHLLPHKSPSEIRVFKCALCSYETNQKGNLREHVLTHRSPLEKRMFKCAICPYETNSKIYLRRHLVIHKRPSEIKMLQCEYCSYRAKRKSHLTRHLLTHKSPSEIKMFKCESCSYETKYTWSLKTHVLTHSSQLYIKMFKCEVCPYKANSKDYLRRHSLTHKRPSVIKTFKCEICSYKTKRKSDLKAHLLTHKSPSDIKMFECKFCPYQTIWKRGLTSHLLTHKSPSEIIKVFKCALCSYKAKQKSAFKTHVLTHI